jgi:hypothetical protein
LEDALRDIFELHADLYLCFVERYKKCLLRYPQKSKPLLTFSGLEYERNTLPSWIVYPKSAGGERRTNRVRWYSLVIEITWLVIRCNVLSEERVLTFDGWDSPEDFYLYRMKTV